MVLTPCRLLGPEPQSASAAVSKLSFSPKFFLNQYIVRNLSFFKSYIYVYYVFVWVYAVGTEGVQKRASESIEVEYKQLGNKRRSWGRAVLPYFSKCS